jgi:hypothetical protein
MTVATCFAICATVALRFVVAIAIVVGIGYGTLIEDGEAGRLWAID